jgi:hypothetical protein
VICSLVTLSIFPNHTSSAPTSANPTPLVGSAGGGIFEEDLLATGDGPQLREGNEDATGAPEMADAEYMSSRQWVGRMAGGGA